MATNPSTSCSTDVLLGLARVWTSGWYEKSFLYTTVVSQVSIAQWMEEAVGA